MAASLPPPLLRSTSCAATVTLDMASATSRGCSVATSCRRRNTPLVLHARLRPTNDDSASTRDSCSPAPSLSLLSLRICVTSSRHNLASVLELRRFSNSAGRRALMMLLYSF
uniref:Putative secreted protein n=1 Tax=Ixodes ricinus TaxID=34613 RepID=A0A6B0UJU5_IXORI